MNELAQRIQEHLASERNELFGILDELLRVPSLSGTLEQNACIDVVRSHLTPGAEVDDWVPDPAALGRIESPAGVPMYVALDQTCGPKHAANAAQARCLVASTGTGHPHLVLNGHIDVVPAGPVGWSHDPFEPIIEDGRIVARGSVDMKAGVVAALVAFNTVAELGLLPHGRLSLAVVPEEETGGNGTLACVERGHIGDGVMFIEHTALQAVHRHIGIQPFELTVTGREGNMLKRGPQAGLNAIDVMAHVLLALQELSERRLGRAVASGGYADDDHPAFINVGSIEGGEWIATRARRAHASGLFSILPDETIHDARDDLRAAITDAVAKFTDATAAITFEAAGHPGADLDASDPLVRSLVDAGADLGINVQPSQAGAMVCDAKIVHGGGWAPAVVFGPHGGRPHGANEYVEVESVVQCAEALALAAVNYCAAASGPAQTHALAG